MKITINTPYWSAWKRYGWKDNTWGLGLRKHDLTKCIENNEMLRVEIKQLNKEYFVCPNKAVKFVKKHKTMFIARGQTLLYVIPYYLLEGKGGETK